ncbi:hypothetical protein [Sporolactobacillus terrae]|uniref:hypothetical protein n=1 Tax=Sporolactobacillus terrae TaxID=269673 RepID=UPI00049097E5|nr:hypothetical protein [Sporolactobacillus terrae]
MEAGILDYARITDPRHKQYNRVGRLTDFDFVDKEYTIFFDKIGNDGHIHWTSESSRVRKNQIERAFESDLEKIS